MYINIYICVRLDMYNLVKASKKKSVLGVNCWRDVQT